MSIIPTPRPFMRTWFISAFITAHLFLAPPAWADYDSANAALKAGNFAAASVGFIEAAERGDTGAALKLGSMREQGQGLMDAVEATYWYIQASEEGNHEGTRQAAIAAIERLGGIYQVRPSVIGSIKRPVFLTAAQLEEQLAYRARRSEKNAKNANKGFHDKMLDNLDAEYMLLVARDQIETLRRLDGTPFAPSTAEKQDLVRLEALLEPAKKELAADYEAESAREASATLDRTMKIEASEFSKNVILRGKQFRPQRVPEETEAVWSLDVAISRSKPTETFYFLTVKEDYAANGPRRWSAATNRAESLEVKSLDRQLYGAIRDRLLFREITNVVMPTAVLQEAKSRSFAVQLTNGAGVSLVIVIPRVVIANTLDSAKAAAARFSQ